MNSKRPLILSVVSGKGGVGKTMLTVAIARELAFAKRTLLIVLDFFNRGLTGLLRHGKEVCPIPRPEFLGADSGRGEGANWQICEVTANLFHISYPDLYEDEIRAFETMTVPQLKEPLERFVLEAAAACDCDCVVLDCHGGPDNSSFAACMLSDHSLMVSEPDRITFYGTMNFMRQYIRASHQIGHNLWLVFNKVVPAFSGLYLKRLYNQTIQQYFHHRPLLAIYPMEMHLTKEFERTPILTEVYPNSLLARKTQVMIWDLLKDEHEDKISRLANSIPGWMRAFRRNTLGKTFFLLDLDFIMPAIVAGVFAVVGTFIFGQQLLREVLEMNEVYFWVNRKAEFLGMLAVVWFGAALLMMWTRQLDNRFTYYSRLRNYVWGIIFVVVAAVIWFFPLLILGATLNDILFPGDHAQIDFSVVYGFVIWPLFVVVVLDQWVRIWRHWRYERRRFEGLLRALFCVSLFAAAAAGYYRLF